MLRLADRWVWDSWIADDGELYHLFFLTAPRDLGDPALRHERAVIGHATSPDLVGWTVRSDALHPAESGWDDLALWTGSVVRGGDGRWRMFYTGIRRGGHGIRDQRIGVAVSRDLEHWEREGAHPVLEVDATRYATLDGDPGASETWRDPFVFRDPEGDGWRMLVTARRPGGPRNGDGVLAEARSADLEHWTLGAPVTNTAGFGQLEVPQVRVVDGAPVLVFTCHPDEQSEERRRRFGHHCTWAVAGSSVTGPWDLAAARPFAVEPDLFAAPLVQRRDGGWAFVGFRNLEARGLDGFEIGDPIDVRREGDALVAIR